MYLIREFLVLFFNRSIVTFWNIKTLLGNSEVVCFKRFSTPRIENGSLKWNNALLAGGDPAVPARQRGLQGWEPGRHKTHERQKH